MFPILGPGTGLSMFTPPRQGSPDKIITRKLLNEKTENCFATRKLLVTSFISGLVTQTLGGDQTEMTNDTRDGSLGPCQPIRGLNCDL